MVLSCLRPGGRVLPAATVLLAALALAGCGGGPKEPRLVAGFPLDDIDAITPAGDPDVSFDPEISVDGKGSVHVTPKETRVVRLLDVQGLDLEGPLKLSWKAHLRSRSLFDPAMLEIWVHGDDGGEYFARDLDSDIRRSTEWTEVEVTYLVPDGIVIDRVRLNLLCGTGHAWIDDARLYAGPAQ